MSAFNPGQEKRVTPFGLYTPEKYTSFRLYIPKVLLLKKAGKVTGFFGLRNSKTLII